MLEKFLKQKGFTLDPACGPNYWQKSFPAGNDIAWRITISFDESGVQYVSIGAPYRGCITLFREDLRVILPIISNIASFWWR
jgi:hypothetical protein